MAPPEPTVFIVDDDASICAALARLFRSAGLAAQSFGCAREFMDQARKLGPGCLILDHRLPDLSGLELQAELARAGIGLPVIFLTAHGTGSLRAKALPGRGLGLPGKAGAGPGPAGYGLSGHRMGPVRPTLRLCAEFFLF